MSLNRTRVGGAVSRPPTGSPPGSPQRLRLAGTSRAIAAVRQADREARQKAEEAQLTGSSDPRWVLAVRVGQELEGTLLRPERREKLIQMGKLLGLSPFDANLIIAIVQDQARRGYEPSYCPTAGEKQLAMIPLPSARQRLNGRLANRRLLIIMSIVTGFVTLELLLLKLLFS